MMVGLYFNGKENYDLLHRICKSKFGELTDSCDFDLVASLKILEKNLGG